MSFVDSRNRTNKLLQDLKTILDEKAIFKDTYHKNFPTQDIVKNIVPGVADKEFIIWAIIIHAKNIGTNPNVYEADDATTSTSFKDLFVNRMQDKSLIFLGSLDLRITKGKFINAKPTKDGVDVQIIGYYADPVT